MVGVQMPSASTHEWSFGVFFWPCYKYLPRTVGIAGTGNIYLVISVYLVWDGREWELKALK